MNLRKRLRLFHSNPPLHAHHCIPQTAARCALSGLALNLPGPAALMRLAEMGARCLKVEPPGPGLTPTGRPMSSRPHGPLQHRGLQHPTRRRARVVQMDLKTERGRTQLARELAKADLLITSFRPSALQKLGLNWRAVHRAHPELSMVEIVGAPGDRCRRARPRLDLPGRSRPGHWPDLPPTLLADMGGALLAVEASLAVLMQAATSGKGAHRQVALSDAAHWLALPRTWGLTLPTGAVGGAHAGYRVYPCKDGRVAIAALEPHFAAALFEAAGLPPPDLRAFRPESARGDRRLGPDQDAPPARRPLRREGHPAVHATQTMWPRRWL